MARGVIIGLGNPDRGDDGAGPAVLARLQEMSLDGAELRNAGADPLALLDLWDGADWAIVLDVAVSGAPAGTLHRIEAAEGALPKEMGRFSTHGFGLCEAVELGRTLGHLPRRLVVYAVEGAGFDHGAGLSPAVAAALDDLTVRLGEEVRALNGAEEEAPCTKPA